MNAFPTFLILAAAYLLVFLQSTFNVFRDYLGAQIDLLPSLMVYAGLNVGLVELVVIAVSAGLWFDSLSANPLGVSCLPLFLIGFIISRYRGLILREQRYAQWLLGLGASAAAPVLVLMLLLNIKLPPLVGWFSLWQWVFVSLIGATATPLWFVIFDWIQQALSYRPMVASSFREDREIKRGKQ